MAGDRYNDPDFIGWLKVNLSLIFAKEGLEQFSDDEVQTFHDNIKRTIPSSSAPGPHTCIDKRKLTHEWQKGRFSCQADHCHLWLGGIKKEYLNSPASVEWDNSDLARLSTDPWACAKLYMPYGCASHTRAKHADIAALLTLYLKCSHFGGFFTNVEDCQKIKNIRNSMMHSAAMKADASTVTTDTQVIIQFLEDLQNHQQPQHQQATKNAVLNIKELLSGKTELSLNREYELRVLNDKLGSLVNEVDALSKAVPDLSSMTLDTRADVTSNTGELKTLTAELDKVKSQSEVFNQFITDYKIGVSPEKLSEVNNNIARLDNQIQSQLKELTDRVEEVEKQCKKLSQETVELKQEQVKMKKTLEEVSKERRSSKEQEEVKKEQTGTKRSLEEVGEEQNQTKRIALEENVTKSISYKEEPPSSKEEDSESNPFDSDHDDTNDDESSAQFKLRDYQLELAETANKGINTIVCAPTGVGKTWVALHIIQKHLQKHKEGKVVFMAPTSALIKQQADKIKKYLSQYQTKLLQGDVDNTQMVGEYLGDYKILCFTPQILNNNLENGSVKSLTQLSLIILDECHHTRGDGPYSNLMRQYLMEKADTTGAKKLPQIVGLTATLGVGKSSTDTDALDYILRICSLLDVKHLSTVKKHNEAMAKENSTPDEEIIKMQVKEPDPARDILMVAIHETEEMLRDLALMEHTLIRLMCECPDDKKSPKYNNWTHDMMKATQSHMYVNDADTSRNIRSCASYLNVYNLALDVNALLGTQDVIVFLAQKHEAENKQQKKLTDDEKQLFNNLRKVQKQLDKDARKEMNPNLEVVREKLHSMLEKEGEESRAIVFVEARATCKALRDFLTKELAKINVKVGALYGKDTRGNDEGMTQADQDKTVRAFREGHYKVIVATSIGAEGIDIPDCNMSLSYNYSGNAISKVQRRGRIRKQGGKNINVVKTEGLEKERISAYKEAMMLRAMVDFEKMSEAEIEKKVNLYQQEEMQKCKFKKVIELTKKQRQANEGDFEIRCKGCDAFACHITDVRKIKKVHHIVIDKTFTERIEIKRPNKSKAVDGFNIDRDMLCKKCPQKWGNVAENNGMDCRMLLLRSLKLVDRATGETQEYRKWIDIPYIIPEIDIDALKRFLGEPTD